MPDPHPGRELVHRQADLFSRNELAGPFVASSERNPPVTSLSSRKLSDRLLYALSHHGLIALCGFAGLLAALLLQLRTQPVYRTVTSIEISAPAAPLLANNSAATADLQTQVLLLQSHIFLHQVANQLKVQPHPNSILRNDLLSRIERELRRGGSTTIPYSTVVDDTSQRVSFKQLGQSRLVEITCESPDPQISTAFCNTLPALFEQQSFQTKSAELQKTRQWLNQQVSEVRQRTEDFQRQLDEIVGTDGLVFSQTTESAGELSLKALQDELIKAQADRMQKQGAAQVAQTAKLDTLPDVQDNPTHRAYEARLSDLRAQLAQLVPTLTEQNPKVIKLRAQIADTEAGLQASAVSSAGRQNSEYEAALHREDLLDMAYKEQEAVVSAELQKIAQVTLLRKEVESGQQLYQTLLQRAREAELASLVQTSALRVVDPAQAPQTPFSPRRTLIGAAGSALGLLFGVGLAFYRESTHQVFRTPEDVPLYLHLQELGVIPATSFSVPAKQLTRINLSRNENDAACGPAIHQTHWEDSFSLTAEAYRNATLSILLADTGKRTKKYVVSSPNMGEGKTTVTSNLGVALSKSKLRIVLVDGDLRRPNLHNAFALENHFGLRNILRGEIDLDAVPVEALTRRTSFNGVSVIPAGEGQEEIGELLHSPWLGILLARLTREFDLILIDSPPILHMADSRILAAHTDGAILVLRSGKTGLDQALQARNLLAKDQVPLIGTILNDFNPAAEGKPGYYAAYHRYNEESR